MEWFYDPYLPSHEYIQTKQSEKYCITPGLTVSTRNGRVYNHEQQRPPNVSHHKVYKKVSKNGGCGLAEGDPCIKLLRKGRGKSKFSYGAVRTRTPTSAGMNDIEQRHDTNTAELTKLWDDVLASPSYQINKDQAQETILFFKENLASIAKENLKGQCTKGHSC